MPNPPTTKTEFEKLTSALAEELQAAHIDYQMYEDLAKAADAHPDVAAQSSAFWGMTIQSHLNSALLRLCRIYDQESRSMNLGNWLYVIKAHPDWFTDGQLPMSEVENDIKYSSNHNSTVRNLTKYRGNVVAHLGQNYVLNVRGTRESFKLTHGDVKDLLQRGLQIVNRYSTLYSGRMWSPNLVGADDYEFIFRELQSEIDRRKAE